MFTSYTNAVLEKMKELTATLKTQMMTTENSQLAPYFDIISTRMNNLNLCLLTIQGFSEEHLLGASDYLKLEKYIIEDNCLTEASWCLLWENHLYGILSGYLEGKSNSEKDICKLKRAFDMCDEYIVDNDKIKIKEELHKTPHKTFEFDFDINSVLKELEGLSVKDRIEALESLYGQLEEAAQEVLSARDSINDEYETEMRGRIATALYAYIQDNHLEDSISLVENAVEVKRNDRIVRIMPICCSGEWSLVIDLDDWREKDAVRFEHLQQLADKLGLTYKPGKINMEVTVEEGEVIGKMIEIVEYL